MSGLLTGLVAVYGGPNVGTIHLHLPSYKSQKARSVYPTSLCGVSVNHTTPPPVGPRPTGRIWVPFDKALVREREYQERLRSVVTTDDPWLLIKDRHFCGKCMGMAAQHGALTEALLDLLLTAVEESSIAQSPERQS